MKTLRYAIIIDQPREQVFEIMINKALYPEWAKAWGEGMSWEGQWAEGKHISFFDQERGGTKVLIESFTPSEEIKAIHVAMVNPNNEEVALTDEMMKKWIGTREEYYFRKTGKATTTLEVVVLTDEVFEKMMDTWQLALKYFKALCEAQT